MRAESGVVEQVVTENCPPAVVNVSRVQVCVKIAILHVYVALACRIRHSHRRSSRPRRSWSTLQMNCQGCHRKRRRIERTIPDDTAIGVQINRIAGIRVLFNPAIVQEYCLAAGSVEQAVVLTCSCPRCNLDATDFCVDNRILGDRKEGGSGVVGDHCSGNC